MLFPSWSAVTEYNRVIYLLPCLDEPKMAYLLLEVTTMNYFLYLALVTVCPTSHIQGYCMILSKYLVIEV